VLFRYKVIDRLWPDPVERAKAQVELLKLQQSGDLAVIAGQMDINKVEAASASLFVSGWRPFVGWICGVGLGMQFLVSPLITWGAELAGRTLTLPALDLSTLITLLGGMLGIAGLRTVEKVRGVART